MGWAHSRDVGVARFSAAEDMTVRFYDGGKQFRKIFALSIASFTILFMSKVRAKKIKLILFDVDGVLTDGTIWLFPTPAGIEQPTQLEAGKNADAGGYAIV